MVFKNENDQLQGKVQIGTVIDLYPSSGKNLKSIREEIMKLIRCSDERIRFDYEFITKEGKARFMLWGNNEEINKMISIINSMGNL